MSGKSTEAKSEAAGIVVLKFHPQFDFHPQAIFHPL
jgi:hypothetical protein